MKRRGRGLSCPFDKAIDSRFMIEAILAFAVAAVVLTVTPGLDTTGGKLALSRAP